MWLFCSLRTTSYHQQKRECDFLLREGNTITQAIQVTQYLQDPQTQEREYAGLLEALQAYRLSEGLILTENESRKEVVTVHDQELTIHIRPVWEWMLDRFR